MKKHIIFILVLFSIVWLASTAFGAIIVGRIAHVEGKIYRYIDVDQSWIETFVESPAGTQDTLTTGDDSRAEIAFPNNVLVGLDEHGEIDILEIADDTGIFALQTGLARFYNRNAAGSLAVETVMGTVKVGPESIVDVRVHKNSVVVSAVHGEATFQSSRSDIEKLEVITGSTSLEFHEDSIIAGIGPIDRNWDRWCASRVDIWSRNRVVHSKYLPETMQEYAYTLEPYGNWRRIYYRGYYYWAWKPRHVTIGWAPYTTGFWHDWREGSVWIDHNPWGWVTHHHGHWIHMQGAWLWTPYVHVSYVPGVTVVGFNITFGKAYRPYWHPGRVRWISYSNHIGWLPLAPWETYYGYRQWGPRSVVMHGGTNFNININLKNHRYVDHTVIIPRQHFYQKGPLITNYNSVKIKNINKTVIVKNYKPLPTMKKQKNRKYGSRKTRADTREKRIVSQPEKQKTRKRAAATTGQHRRKQNAAKQDPKAEQQEKIVYKDKRATAKKTSGTIKKKRQIANSEKIQERAPGSRQKTATEKIKYQKKTTPGNIIIANNAARRSGKIEARNQRDRQYRQTATKTSKKVTTKKGNNSIAVRQHKSGQKKQAQEKKRATTRQDKQIEEHGKRTPKKTVRQYAENIRPDKVKKEKQVARMQQYNPQQNRSRKRLGERQKTGRDFVSASLNNRRLR
jgi:hypothetical protein